jgi:hypothetical protein
MDGLSVTIVTLCGLLLYPFAVWFVLVVVDPM